MLERTMTFVAIVLSVIVALGFILFVVDDAGRASNGQVGEVASFQQADTAPVGVTSPVQHHGGLRKQIDDANDVLLKPFAGIADTAHSRWVQRGVPALLGLLVYGFGLGYLARFARGRG